MKTDKVLMMRFTESFVEGSELSYSAIIFAFLTKEDLTWQLLSSRMLQEPGYHKTLKSTAEPEREGLCAEL